MERHAREVSPELRRLAPQPERLCLAHRELGLTRRELGLAGPELDERGLPRPGVGFPLAPRIPGEEPLEGKLGRPVVPESARGIHVQPREIVERARVQRVPFRHGGDLRVEIARRAGLPLSNQLVRAGQQLSGFRSPLGLAAEPVDRTAACAESSQRQDEDKVSHEGGAALGRRTVKQVPFPSSLSTAIEPSWASTSPLTMARPSPEPFRPRCAC